jgi:hypothetical protein
MLEKLVHYNGVLPPNQHFIRIETPVGTSSRSDYLTARPQEPAPDPRESKGWTAKGS